MVVAAAVAMGEMDMFRRCLAKMVTVLADGGDVKDGLARSRGGRRGCTLIYKRRMEDGDLLLPYPQL